MDDPEGNPENVERMDNMKILLTGNKGFVGTHIQESLEQNGHEIIGLEAHPTFAEWYDEMHRVTDLPVDAVIHAGAIPYNQSKDPHIYLWNSHATYLLAQRIRENMGEIPFILFSTFLVESTLEKERWDARTGYAWSKAIAEEHVNSFLPNSTILRPAVQWGDERNKSPKETSVPYQLSTRQLKYLFSEWGRSYVHISDVIQAIKICLKDNPAGAFLLSTEYRTNKELAKMVDWEGYEWLDNPEASLGYRGVDHISDLSLASPLVPNWKPSLYLEDELPKMEKRLNNE